MAGRDRQRLSRRRRYGPGRPAVSVLTPTIPGREPLLAELVASVAGQTHQGHEHLILRDHRRRGCAVTVNRLAGHARADWLFVVADDDILLPRCLELHLAAAKDADVVSGPPVVWGENPAQFQLGPPNMPAVALIRPGLWRKLGGYDEQLAATEDYDLWARALDHGAVFARLDQPTWVYRFHGGNKSRQ